LETSLTAASSSGRAVPSSASALSLTAFTSAAYFDAASSSTTTTDLTASALRVFSAMTFLVCSTSI